MKGPRGMTTTIRAAAIGALALALAGCGLTGPKPPPTLFTLAPDRPMAPGGGFTGKSADAIVVLDPATDRRLGVQRVAVQVDASNVAYLKKAMWVERPARLFGSLIAEAIRAKGNRLVFAQGDVEGTGRTQLGGRLLDMGYDAASASVVVRYDAVRETPGGAVTTRRFEASEPVGKADPALVGPALNRAANKVAGEVADWVG